MSLETKNEASVQQAVPFFIEFESYTDVPEGTEFSERKG
jgi:hypothetical protein